MKGEVADGSRIFWMLSRRDYNCSGTIWNLPDWKEDWTEKKIKDFKENRKYSGGRGRHQKRCFSPVPNFFCFQKKNCQKNS